MHNREQNLYMRHTFFNACVLCAHSALSVNSSHDSRAAQQAAAAGLLRIVETVTNCATVL